MRLRIGRRTVRVSAPPEGAGHGQEGQASARGEEAEEEQGQEGGTRRGDPAHGRDPPQLRLFVAVRPPAAALEHLATALGRDVDARWHVTLAFLGEQPDPGAFALAKVARAHPAFPLALSGAVKLGKVVAVGLRGDTTALGWLAHDVQRACRDAGAALERRRYQPHLTVGRGEVPDALWEYEGPAWTVSAVELVKSVLGRSAQHETLERFALG
jgi:2'-5' RNA ligase